MKVAMNMRGWVPWWIVLGAVGGLAVFLLHTVYELSFQQKLVFAVVGISFWALGGLLCWATKSANFEFDASASLPPAAGMSNKEWKHREDKKEGWRPFAS